MHLPRTYLFISFFTFLFYTTFCTAKPSKYERIDLNNFENIHLKDFTIPPSLSLNCNTNGFTGTYKIGVAMTAANKFSVTITNNSFCDTNLTFSPSDLSLSGVSGLTVSSVSPTSTILLWKESIVIEYTLGGVPNSGGSSTLTGTFTYGGLSCENTVTMTTNGTVTSFNCTATIVSPAGFKSNGDLYSGTATLSYLGGNGGSYPSGSVASTGVTGFTASWAAGTLATGAGTITVTITGSSNTAGISVFPVTIAGKSCSIRLEGCGAPTSSGGWLVFKCHNLGADETADPFTPSWKLNGAYIQWGKRGPTGNWQTEVNNGAIGFIAAPTASDDNALGGIANFSTTIAANGSWNVNENSPVKTINDPCPNGFRVPTHKEWVSIYSASPIDTRVNWVRVGTWTQSATNYSSGRIVNNRLYLPAAGHYTEVNAVFNASRGANGLYHSSTPYATNSNNANQLSMDLNSVSTLNSKKVYAKSVRCVLE